MYKNKKIIAIIPARSGSKGLKDKNIKDLNGKPLIAYTIDAAKSSGVFDEIMVSTDSEKYAQISKEYGASVPFLRSEENANDKADSWNVVKEVLNNYEQKLDKTFDVIVLLQPTSPLRTSTHITEAMELFFNKNADTLFSVCETPHPIFWCNTIDETMSAKDFIKPEYNVQRQKLPKSYTLNGAIYIIKTNCLDNLDLYGDNSYLYVMPKENSVDIDSELDFKYVETIMDIK